MGCASSEARRSIVVTGAKGFIGSHLVQAFLARGSSVVGIDRLTSTGDASPAAGYTTYGLDLPAQDLGDVFAQHQPHLVIHAAGPASVSDSMIRPAGDFSDNVPPLLNLLESIRHTKIGAKVVLISSAAVYGNPEHLPINEDARLAPLSPYGWHKAMCEMALQEYALLYGVAACTLRVFSAYGPGLRRQVMWDICSKARAGGPVRLDGTGRESRDFVHVRDIAAGVHLVAERSPMRGEVYNLASGIETQIAELAHALVEALGERMDVRFTGEPRPGDPKRWQADLSRIGRLGYRPSIDINQGIRQYAEWFNGLYAGPADG